MPLVYATFELAKVEKTVIKITAKKMCNKKSLDDTKNLKKMAKIKPKKSAKTGQKQTQTLLR